VTSLAGRVIVLTGAGRGIGREVAVQTARLGAKLLLNARSANELAETERQVAAAGAPCVVVPGDLGEPATATRIAETAQAMFGGCDVLANVGGRGGPIGEVETLDPAAFTDTLRVNVLGTFLTCRAILPMMKARGSGRIVNVASGLAEFVQPGQAAYSASKAAVVQFTRVLAAEVADTDIRVNAVHPGVVRTRMVDALCGLPRTGVGRSIVERMEALSSAGMVIEPEVSARFLIWMFTRCESHGAFVRITDPEPKAALLNG
jgi:3-oxoacyl-[acyl-carrier protein] reductase